MIFFKQLVVLSILFLGLTLDAMEKKRTFYVHIEASQDKYHTSSSNVKEAQTNEITQTNNSFYRPNVNYIKEIKDNLKSHEYRDNLLKIRASLEEKLNKCTFDNTELKKQIKFIDELLDGSINRLLIQIKKGDLKTATKAFTTLKKAWPREDNHVSSIVVGHSSIENNFIEIIGTDIMQIARNSLVLRKDFLEANDASVSQIQTYLYKIRDIQLRGDRKSLLTEREQLIEQFLNERHSEFKLTIEAKLIIVHSALSNPMTRIFSTIKNANIDKAVKALDDLKEQLSDHFEAHNITNKAEAKADMIKREGVDLFAMANKCYKSRPDYQAVTQQTSNASQDNSAQTTQKKVITNAKPSIKPTYAYDNVIDFQNDTMKSHKISIQDNSTCASSVTTNNSKTTSHNSAHHSYAYADAPSSAHVNTNNAQNIDTVCDNKIYSSEYGNKSPGGFITIVSSKDYGSKKSDNKSNNVDSAQYFDNKNKECVSRAVSSEFKAMQMNGEKKELEIKKEQLKEELRHTWNLFKIRSIWAQIAEIDKILESWVTETLSIIKDADIYTAREEFYRLEGLAKWQGESSYDPIFCDKESENVTSLSDIYNAAQKIFYARSDLAPNIPTYTPVPLEKKDINNSIVANNQNITNKQVITNQDTYAQHLVTQALNPTYNLNLVTQKLGNSVDLVYTDAHKHNYLIPHEVDLQIQTSLDTLPNVKNEKEFAYNIATINHLLCDIQDQAAMQNNLPSNISERSPDLLTRAIQEYWKDLAPTENEISFVSDLACYISDVTIGTSYLAPEVVEQRVQEFWNGVDKLSFENMSQLTTEDWIDASAYVAARATWAVGITKTAAVIRNLKNVGTAIGSTAASFADKFVKIFDNVIGGSPAVITADGAVIVNASPVVVAEAAQALYSLNGMEGDKPTIIKDVDGVLSIEKKLTEATQSTAELRQSILNGEKKKLTPNELKRLRFRGDSLHHIEEVDLKTGKITAYTELQGDMEKAQKILDTVKKEFESRKLIEDGTKISKKNGSKMTFYAFEDGSRVQIRTEGKSGHIKIDITDISANIYEKITFK